MARPKTVMVGFLMISISATSSDARCFDIAAASNASIRSIRLVNDVLLIGVLLTGVAAECFCSLRCFSGKIFTGGGASVAKISCEEEPFWGCALFEVAAFDPAAFDPGAFDPAPVA